MSPEMADSGILEMSEYLMSFAIRSAYQNESIYLSGYEHFVTVLSSSIHSPVSPGNKLDEETNCDSYIDNRLHFISKWFCLISNYVLQKDPGVDGRIILSWIFRKWDVEAWTGSSWLRIGTVGRHL